MGAGVTCDLSLSNEPQPQVFVFVVVVLKKTTFLSPEVAELAVINLELLRDTMGETCPRKKLTSGEQKGENVGYRGAETC